MTATPRQLSDAIQADYEEVIAARPDETAAIARWTHTRTVAGWITLGTVIGFAFLVLLTMLTASLFAFVLLVFAFIGSPFLVIPGFIMWLVASTHVSRLEAARREAIFTTYGISIDRSVSPHVYSIAVPATWVKPELHRTRALLLAADEDRVTADSK